MRKAKVGFGKASCNAANIFYYYQSQALQLNRSVLSTTPGDSSALLPPGSDSCFSALLSTSSQQSSKILSYKNVLRTEWTDPWRALTMGPGPPRTVHSHRFLALRMELVSHSRPRSALTFTYHTLCTSGCCNPAFCLCLPRNQSKINSTILQNPTQYQLLHET